MVGALFLTFAKLCVIGRKDFSNIKTVKSYDFFAKVAFCPEIFFLYYRVEVMCVLTAVSLKLKS